MSVGSKNDQENSGPELPSHYIGIGASAGGLEALQTLLQNLPTDTGACFVIVQHLSPNFKSMMLELLSKHTQMQIHNVKDGMLTAPNTIYLLPPKKTMIVSQGQLLLSDKVLDAGLNLPIDVFFRSLAEDQQHRAIGIILSGTGSDGSRGLKALKEAGALVIAQQPDSAKFDGMPNSAINTGIVDLILRPEDMGKQLEAYTCHPLVSGEVDLIIDDMETSQDIMAEIFNILRIKSDIDFSKYKSGTMARRIERRMTIKQVTSLREYLSLLFKDIYEVKVLSKELLIGVTRFFRDDEAFKILRNEIIPQIVASSQPNQLIRVWVAACSSGEEAYSIAILMQEELKKQGMARDVKIFATDVNSLAITEASAGLYGRELENDIDSHLLSEYFNKSATGGYQISQKIRHTVVFAVHNLITDPPFSNIDLVTCRNVLIYFQTGAQQRVLSSLHFALNKKGFLFLGSSENLGNLASHFQTLNDRQKIYQKINGAKLPLETKKHMSGSQSESTRIVPSVTDLMKSYRGSTATVSPLNFINEALISNFVSPCVILNDDLEAMHVYGDLSLFTRRLAPGKISTEIGALLNDDIKIAVTSAIHSAKMKNQPVLYTEMITKVNDQSTSFNLHVNYIKEHDIVSSPGFFWVIFEPTEHTTNTLAIGETFDVSKQAAKRIEGLELELKFNKEHLQVTIEELETTNEELQSANEELMSANEELQSTNEELQSVNEELYSVNTEYQEKIFEISQANGDLDEVLGLSKIGVIFLDENLLIRRYTDAVKNYVNLQDTDVNRPLHHISTNINYKEMLNDVATVFRTGISIEKEIVQQNKKFLRVLINPYNYNNTVQTQGVAVTFSDISQERYMELAMAVAYRQLRSSVNNALEMLDTTPFNDNINVLILDDSAAHLELLQHKLQSITSYNVTVYQAKSTQEAFACVAQNEMDICISDYFLSDESALDLIDGLKQTKVSLPVVVVTGNKNDELTPLLMRHGAIDLIEKDDITPALLERSIKFAIRRHQIDADINNMLEKHKNTVLSE